MISNFSFPNRIVFGPGAIAQLPDLLAERKATRVLLVTDPGIVRAGLAQKTRDLLAGRIDVSCFDGVTPNPTEDCVEAAADRLRSEACDMVIGLGGGSAMDAAKAACLRLNHRLPITEYEIQVGGDKKVTDHVPALIAVPTTAGTGSEVGRSAVITLKAEGRKAILNSPKLLPAVAICDPELTVGLSPPLTAATGMDALTHNLEAYLATTFHPICDAVALGGVRLVAKSLARAVGNGRDLEARSDMMLASSMGAIAFQNDLGAAHALAHPLSTLAGVPHGLANAIVLPHVMAFNKTVTTARLKDIADALGCITAGRSDDAAADLAIAAVRDLLARIGLPDHLSAVGVSRGMIPGLAAQAIADANHTTNPRPCTKENMANLYRAAL